MARTEVKRQKLSPNEGKEITFTAASSVSDGFKLDYTGKDNKTLFVFTGSGTVTIKKGNGIQGTGEDVVVNVAAQAVFAGDSGAFKNVSGEDKDYLVAIPSATGIKAAVVELP